MEYGSPEFAYDPEINHRLNQALQAFNAGPLTGDMSKLRGDPLDAELGRTVTYVFNINDDQHIAAQAYIGEEGYLYYLFGKGIPENIRYKNYEKSDDHTPLSRVGDVSRVSELRLDPINEIASPEEALSFLTILENFNTMYELHEKTDLLGNTNRRFQEVLGGLMKSEHPLVKIESSKFGFQTVSVADHELYAEFKTFDSGMAIISFNGERAPERLQDSDIYLDFDKGIHVIRPLDVNNVLYEPFPRLMFYPKRDTPRRRSKDGVDNFDRLPIGVVSDTEAQGLIALLETYLDGTGWQPEPGKEYSTPVVPAQLEVTKAAVERIFEPESPWKIQDNRYIDGRTAVRSLPKQRVLIERWSPDSKDFRVKVMGRATPEKLAGLVFEYRDYNGEITVREFTQSTVNPLKVIADGIREARNRPARKGWAVSYGQVQDINEILSS